MLGPQDAGAAGASRIGAESVAGSPHALAAGSASVQLAALLAVASDPIAFHHADGAWLVLYAWLRLEAGLPPCVAYEEAIRRGSDVRWTASLAERSAQSVA
ncbi:hypothetical protein Hoch_0586 [Haliangium ochraceum DSM 14365]|uniref:Uncharacterized protein n=2 Tax=Haliangium ochraceum TaxID=80816 RepID=D0LLK7_HALO1|nr:hypothetical protein Hoch_0586 [Haliangium ochraceum DSM 14365]